LTGFSGDSLAEWTPFERLDFSRVDTFTIDMGSHESDDSVDEMRLQGGDLAAAGLQVLEVKPGIGTNTIRVQSGVNRLRFELEDEAYNELIIENPGTEVFLLGQYDFDSIQVAAGAAIYCTVTSTADSGPGTLRAAIDCSQRIGASIAFQIPDSDPNRVDVDAVLGGDLDADVFVIRPLSVLPALTHGAIVIDGTTQADYGGDTNPAGPEIVLQGSMLPVGAGFRIESDDNAVWGIGIQSFPGSGVVIRGNRNSISNSYLGTDMTGGVALGNLGAGVLVDGGQDNLIVSNLVAGNVGGGVHIEGASASRNVVAGNFIGTNRHGAADLGNGTAGILIDGAPENVIGGGGEVARNYISGNEGPGVLVTASASRNQIVGNYIGRSELGAEPGNFSDGILIIAASDNLVSENVISANSDNGIEIDGLAADGNLVQSNVIVGNEAWGVLLGEGTGNRFTGNSIGTDPNGARESGNGAGGILLERGASFNWIGGTDGDDISLGSNRVAFNGGAGIVVQGAGSIGNTVRGNAIYDNLGLGIDLGNDGVSGNDRGDLDMGPNRLQNFPLLQTAVVVPGQGLTRVTGQLESNSRGHFTLDFYSITQADVPSGYGEGRLWLGRLETDANPQGSISFGAWIAATGHGEFLTATATDSEGNTSEFSLAIEVLIPPPDHAAGGTLPGAMETFTIEGGVLERATATRAPGRSDLPQTRLIGAASLPAGWPSPSLSNNARLDLPSDAVLRAIQTQELDCLLDFDSEFEAMLETLASR
jgi:hypothetical protein